MAKRTKFIPQSQCSPSFVGCQPLLEPLNLEIRWDDYCSLESVLPEALCGCYGQTAQVLAELTVFLLGLNVNGLDSTTVNLTLAQLDSAGKQLAQEV